MRFKANSIVVTVLSLTLVVPAVCLSAHSATAPIQQASRQNAVTQTAADRGWPRGYSLPNEAQVVIYEPQIANWDEQKHLAAYAAVSHVAKGEQKPALGTIRLEADTEVALEQRLVKFSSLKITESNFQTLTKDQTREIVTEVEKNLPQEDRVIALDRVLAYVDKSTVNPKNVEGLKADAPRIIITQSP
jgi:hypothetical protein